jgi:hypothetical protein
LAFTPPMARINAVCSSPRSSSATPSSSSCMPPWFARFVQLLPFPGRSLGSASFRAANKSSTTGVLVRVLAQDV